MRATVSVVAIDIPSEKAAARAVLTEALINVGHEDRAAFAEVYRLTAAKLYGICLRICGDKEAAQDVLHEVYLIAWRRAGSYQPGLSSPITWLSTIARNRAVDWHRAKARRPAAPLAEADMVLADIPAADDMMVRDELITRLTECLAALETKQRDAIRTAFYDGLSYPELAERRDVPLGTMKSWIRRGLMQLRGCLDG